MIDDSDANSSQAEAAARLLEAAFFQDPAGIGQVDSDLDADVPLVTGYHLVRLLGEGGFGMVYEAEQMQPIRRSVALKILRPGFTTRELLARFEQERQALALMNHPHIARIHDAGETDDGRPFIAMELVDGTTIDRFARDASPRAIVSMMALVCHAVAHAHHKGIIHRDLKPSNILVATAADGTSEPRVIDFGIAKALEGPLITRVFFTGMRQVVGTPGYMGPERQSSAPSGQPADTRSDVFALGAILWELLSGERPSIHAEGALLRVTLPEGKPVARELRWIAEMATAVELDRRYPDATALAADLDAWLAGQPVRAAPPGVIYRVRKWVALHPWTGSALAAALLGLVAATTLITYQNRRIRKQVVELQAAAADSRVRSAEQAFLLGLQAVDDSPLRAVLYWYECLRLAPDHPRASGHLASALRQEHLVAILGQSPALPDGIWNDARISPDGHWIATRGVVGHGRTILRMKRGDLAFSQIETPTAGGPWAIDNSGNLFYLTAKNEMERADPAGRVVTDSTRFSGLRYLIVSPDGCLAVAGPGCLGWRAPDGIWRVNQLQDLPEAMAVSQDGSTLVVSAGEHLHRWVVDDPQPTRIQKVIPAPASALGISADGITTCAGWRNGTVQVFKDNEPAGEFVNSSAVLDIYPAGDSPAWIVRSPDGLIWMDQASGMRLSRWDSPQVARWCLPMGKSGAVVSPAAGGVVVIDSRGDEARAWNLPGAEGKGPAAFASDGRTFAVMDETSRTFRWFELRPATEPSSTTLPIPTGALAFAIGPEGALTSLDRKDAEDGGTYRLAAISSDGKMSIADRANSPGVVIGKDGNKVVRDWPKSSALAVSPSGRWLASGTPSGNFEVFSPDSETPLHAGAIQGSAITALAVSDRGRVAAAAAGSIHLRGGGEDPATIARPQGTGLIQFSRNGQRLAIGREDGRIEWHDSTTGESLALPTRVPGKPLQFGWSADDSVLRVLLADGRVMSLPANPGSQVSVPHSLGWHLDANGRVAFRVAGRNSKQRNDF
jgi:predicted Ser/Thr protein kinase